LQDTCSDPKLIKPLEILHIQNISTLLAEGLPGSDTIPLLLQSVLWSEIFTSIDSPFRYADHLCNFSRRGDNCWLWQDTFKI